MGLLRDNMSTEELAEGVSAFLPPSEEEVRRVDLLAIEVRFEKDRDPQALLHELFLLKAGIAVEYAMGMLEKLGMKPEGIRQFHDIYTRRLSLGLAAASPSMPGRSVALWMGRMQAYGEALHRPHPEDVHLNVADAFTRFAGAPDDPQLVTLCLDTCRSLNQTFIDAIASLGNKP